MEEVDKTFARTFGNYNLHGIEEVHLPESVSWMPQTIGWKLLFVLFVLGLCWLLYRQVRLWWRNRYRREALKQLAQLRLTEDAYTVVSRLPFLLKATALQRFPRENIASLSGEPWLEFLSNHYAGPAFNDALGQQLNTIAYQRREQWSLSDEQVDALVVRTREWIKTHQDFPTTPSSISGVSGG